MHISEGVLSAPVLISGTLLSAGGVAIGLKKMEPKKIPEVAMFSAVFFVVSLIHVPIGPSSGHLVLNGLVGLILGWMAFPAILTALTLQALLFQFGGFTVLGVNTFNMAFPALLSYYFFNYLIRTTKNLFLSYASGFLAGVLGVGGGISLIAATLITTGDEFLNIAKLSLITHLPVMVIEGIITSFCVIFLKKVKPEILEVRI